MRVSVYHWLPLADNMLPEVVASLNALLPGIAEDVREEPDAVTYRTVLPLPAQSTNTHSGAKVRGKINQRGFAQHTLEVPPIQGYSLQQTIGYVLPLLHSYLAEFLCGILPIAVRNKLAVLEEGIYPFSRFYTNVFNPLIDKSAQAFLRAHLKTAVLLTTSDAGSLSGGLVLPDLGFDAPPMSADGPLAFASKDNRHIVFFSPAYHEEEAPALDGAIYKLCAAANVADILSRVLDILKETRAHVIPLRRSMAICLQRHTEQHFVTLTRMKRYLTYVNIKLPVVDKVRNHLEETVSSPQYIAKEKALALSNVTAFSAVCAIPVRALSPEHIFAKIREDMVRMAKLVSEDQREVKVISDELSQVLSGSLLAEDVAIANRELDTSRATLELDRTAKNRANALKVLSVLLSANLGLVIADSARVAGLGKIGVAIAIVVLAWVLTELMIRRRSRHYRLVVPVSGQLPPQALEGFTQRHDLQRAESLGGRTIRTWEEKLFVARDGSDIAPLLPAGHRKGLRKKRFAITLDYERRGYVHSMTIETEHGGSSFPSGFLLRQMADEIADCGGLEDDHGRQTSLLAQMLSHVSLPITPELRYMNRILTASTDELRELLTPPDTELTIEDQDFVQDVRAQWDKYITWLTNVEDPATLRLLGPENVSNKKDLVAELRQGGSR